MDGTPDRDEATHAYAGFAFALALAPGLVTFQPGAGVRHRSGTRGVSP